MPEVQTVLASGSPIVGASSDPFRAGFNEDQRRAIEGRQPRIALSAGAGSGKTSVLVERFLSLVDEGIAPGSILAVTFTEKAASEMKDRIIRSFESRGDEANRRHAEAAYISTIHGLCARLLRENPLAARLDPSFGIMDGLTRGIFLDEALQRLYADEWFRSAVDGFRADDRTGYPMLFVLIRDAALKPREFGTDAPEEAAFTEAQHVTEAMRRVDAFCLSEWVAAREAVLAVAEAIFEMEVGGNVRRAQHGEMCEVLRALVAAEVIDPALAKRFCDSTGFTGSVRGHPAIGVVREVLKTNRDVFKRYTDFDREAEEWIERTVMAPLKAGIYRCATALRDEYDAFKRTHGLLDFEDLQARALALVDDPSVREEYSTRFTHILLDEAQDTNPVQMRLLERLRDGRDHLFCVGDLKQSIYGFRGADVDLFRQVCDTAGPGRMSLTENFRSRREVIDLVNAVGERLWEDGSVPFERLETGLDYPASGPGPRVEVRFFSKAEVERDGEVRDESADDVRLREGALFARWIREAVEGGADGTPPLQVFDRHAKAMRPIRYSDVAILTQTRTPVPLYEQSLSADGIPYVKDGGRGFFVGLEITDVLNALRVLLNPLDDAAVLAVLRCPMFAWRDRDLIRLRQAAGDGPLWEALTGEFAPEHPEPAAGAASTLGGLREWRFALPPAALIERLLDRTQYRAALLQSTRGRAQAANLNKLVDFARACAELDGPSLARFVDRAALAERHLADESDAALASPEDDVVTVSTIHGAKGLEWPVVILPCLDSDFCGARSGSTYSAPDGVLLVEPYDSRGETIRPMSHRLVRERIRAREEAEGRRVFYVALTRAREHLVLSGRASYSARTDPARFTKPIEWLARHLDATEHEVGSRMARLGDAEMRLSFIELEDQGDAAPVGGDPDLAAARDRVRRGEPARWANNLELVDPAEISGVIDTLFGSGAAPERVHPPAVTVTDLTYFYRCPLVFYFNLVLQVEEHPRAREKAAGGESDRLTAADLGTRVHALLERADLAADAHVEAVRLTATVSDISPADGARIQQMLADVLSDPIMDRARDAPRLDREYPFSLALDGAVVRGTIDLVFTDRDGRGVVLDYKSNDLSAPDRVNVLTRDYRPQIELYALAAKTAGLADPEEATLFFLNGPVVRSSTVDAARLERIEAEARDSLARIARQDWATEPGEKCRRCGYQTRGFCEIGRQWAKDESARGSALT